MSTELKNLSDEQLIKYHQAYSKLTPRERDRHLTGIDHKKGYHIVRLVQQAEMVLSSGDLDLEKNRELLKDVRNGEWTLEQLETWFEKRQSDLDTLYTSSPLPLLPQYDKLKPLLLSCLEARYGSLSAYFNLEGSEQVAADKLRKIKEIINE